MGLTLRRVKVPEMWLWGSPVWGRALDPGTEPLLLGKLRRAPREKTVMQEMSPLKRGQWDT